MKKKQIIGLVIAVALFIVTGMASVFTKSFSEKIFKNVADDAASPIYKRAVRKGVVNSTSKSSIAGKKNNAYKYHKNKYHKSRASLKSDKYFLEMLSFNPFLSSINIIPLKEGATLFIFLKLTIVVFETLTKLESRFSSIW